MSDKNEGTGSCLCGSVRVQVEKMGKEVGACHCDMCRKWGGGPLIATDCGTAVRFEGVEHISVFDSSKWAERGFCSQCGSHLFYRIKQSGRHVIPVGLLETGQDLVLTHQVFIDEKPSFYHFSNETREMTGAEVFAKFAPSSQ